MHSPMMMSLMLAVLVALSSAMHIDQRHQSGNERSIITHGLVRRAEDQRMELFSHLLDRLKRHLTMEYYGNNHPNSLEKTEANRILRNLMQIQPIYNNNENEDNGPDGDDNSNNNVATLLHLIRGV